MGRLYAPLITVRRFSSKRVLKNVEEIIGLEIHAQLSTKSKLFSSAPVGDGCASNRMVADFDSGVPGTLPRLNRESVLKSIRAALLLNCKIQPHCRFDRKHYFYPDMPMGYQITQQDYPIALNGYFDFYMDNVRDSGKADCRRIRIKQVQLEMDSGKTIRSDDEKQLFIDLNRAGVGLVEIVSEPELRSAAEASLFVDQLRLTLMHNNICGGELHKGNMRVDANVSLLVDGVNHARTELKNINSLKALKRAVENEVKRQKKLLQEGKEITTVTLNVTDEGELVILRSKGGSLDYRFTPEPNLPRLRIEDRWVSEASSSLRTDMEYLDYIHRYQLNPSYALQILKDPERNAFVRSCLSQTSMPVKDFFPWYKELQHCCDSVGHNFPPSERDFVKQFIAVIELAFNGTVTRLVAIDLIKEYLPGDLQQDPITIVRQRNLLQIHPSDAEFAQIVEATIAENQALLEKISKSSGNARQKAFNKLRNAIMARAVKRISVQDASDAVTRLLN